MSREDDVGAAGVGEAAKDSRDELEDILKALEAGDSDKHGPNMKIIIGVIAGIVLVSVVLIIIMVNRKSVVPDFVGHTTAEAKQIAREAGVTLEEKKEYSSEVEEGCVISQDIAKGMKVKRKASVGITVSKGKEMTVVPEFVGETLEDARAMAAEAGIELEETEEYSKDVAAGLIIEQQDTQGTSIEKGSSVKITVSLGEQTVKLPDFVGMTLNDATLGITFSTLQENSDTVDENVIIRQSVKAGTEMTEDTQLYLIVSKGKKTSSVVAASSGSAGGGSGSSGGSGTNEQADSGTSGVNEDEFITEEEEWGD